MAHLDTLGTNLHVVVCVQSASSLRPCFCKQGLHPAVLFDMLSCNHKKVLRRVLGLLKHALHKDTTACHDTGSEAVLLHETATASTLEMFNRGNQNKVPGTAARFLKYA